MIKTESNIMLFKDTIKRKMSRLTNNVIFVHIFKFAKERTEKVEDVCKEGDEFPVKFLGIDEKGRANLSRKDAL